MKISKTFCILPWIHLLGGLAGEWQTCCCVAKSNIIASSGSTISNVWNNNTIRDIRLKMLRGEKVDQCSLCYSLEEARIPSYRVRSNFAWRHHIWKANETRSDGSLYFPLVYLDIRFSNLCNLRCRMCSHYASSSWYEDALHLGTAEDHRVISPWAERTDFWGELREEILPSLELVYFAGGEPLIQQEHYDMLNMLREAGRTDVRLLYNTNLSTIQYKEYDLLNLWNEFEHVSVSASIDGIGKRGDYIRKGLTWERWVENARRLGPYLRGYAPAISIYNIYHYPELNTLMEQLFPGLEERSGIVSFPEFLSIQVFDQDMKRQIELRYLAFIEQNTELSAHAKRNMMGWLKYMVSTDKSHLALAFKEYTSKLDELRNECFVDTFPELAEWYERIG